MHETPEEIVARSYIPGTAEIVSAAVFIALVVIWFGVILPGGVR